MWITRRQMLALTGSSLLSKLISAQAAPCGVNKPEILPKRPLGASPLCAEFLETASPSGVREPDAFDVDRMLEANFPDQGRVEVRRYVANATVTLFSLSLVSKASVGSGFA